MFPCSPSSSKEKVEMLVSLARAARLHVQVPLAPDDGSAPTVVSGGGRAAPNH